MAIKSSVARAANSMRRNSDRRRKPQLLEAEDRGDTDTAEEARHELSWLTGEDDEPIRSAPARIEQLDLFGNPVP